MKRIVCAALALTLLGTTAAQAHGWHGGGYGWHRGHGGDVALGFGLGFLALGIIAAESAHERHYRDRDAYYEDRDGPGAYDRERRHEDDRGGDARGAPTPLHRGDDGDRTYHGAGAPSRGDQGPDDGDD